MAKLALFPTVELIRLTALLSCTRYFCNWDDSHASSRTLKINIFKYRGVEGNSFLQWSVELADVIKTRYIIDERMQVAFPQFNLAGRAKKHLGTRPQVAHLYVFSSLEALKARLKQTFEPPIAEF
ncbi:hypothetical protein CCR75_009215 [Bremia lactucae]|uniref:Uncharacterized protein n=1 Tax=Bremia lactucae TaxID=4779 RepID=A0A976NYE7_BRELC|nr:hypothetical protein CCR75_009215 [Bremia lactucae]